MCAGPPARLTERRNPGSTHSSTSGRQISARITSDTEVMPTMSRSAGSSTASTEPNRKCMRSTLLPFTETMVTPSASATRKNAASEASSFNGVARAIRPAPTAIRNPAIMPPPAIANRLKPAMRKPIAAPGRMACAMASPIRLMRRSIRKTPTGGAPSASAKLPASARRMNSNSANGAMKMA